MMDGYSRGKASPMDWSRSPYQISINSPFDQLNNNSIKGNDDISSTFSSKLNSFSMSTLEKESDLKMNAPPNESINSNSNSIPMMDITTNIQREKNMDASMHKNNQQELQKKVNDDEKRLMAFNSPKKFSLPMVRKRTRRYIPWFSYSSEEENDEEDVEEDDQHLSSKYNINPSITTTFLESPSSQYQKHPSSPVHFYLPYILIGYVQFLFNLSFLCLFLYLLYSVLMAISTDIEMKVNQAMSLVNEEIASCRSHYENNHCGVNINSLPPALETLCRDWESCMKKDPSSSIGRAKVSAETFAEILNGFVERISYKSMIFIIIVAFALLFLSNAAFSFARSRYISRQLTENGSSSDQLNSIGIGTRGLDLLRSNANHFPHYSNDHKGSYSRSAPSSWRNYLGRYGNDGNGHSLVPALKYR